MSVDLPAPFSPTRASTSERSTWSDTSSRARTPPNDLQSPRTDNMAMVEFAGWEGAGRAPAFGYDGRRRPRCQWLTRFSWERMDP